MEIQRPLIFSLDKQKELHPWNGDGVPLRPRWSIFQPKHRFFHWGEFCQGRFADIAPLLLVKINSIQNYSIVQRTLADKDVISFLQHLIEEIQALIRGQIGSAGFFSQSNSYLVFYLGGGWDGCVDAGRMTARNRNGQIYELSCPVVVPPCRVGFPSSYGF